MTVISINLYRIMGLMIRNGIFSHQITCFISISSVANLERTSVDGAEEGRRTGVGGRTGYRGGNGQSGGRKGMKRGDREVLATVLSFPFWPP